MSAAGPPQGARPPGGAARSAVRGERTSAAGPPQGARPPGGAARSAVRGEHQSIAYLGLGSNLAHPRRQLARAVRALARVPGLTVVAVSPNYASAAVGTLLPQPDYVNAVVAVRTRLPARALLGAMHRIERRQHRRRENEPHRNAPRTLDIDLLLYGRRRMHAHGLAIPHPRMHERAFVLRPLADVAAAATIPGRGLAQRFLRRVRDQRVERTRRHRI